MRNYKNIFQSPKSLSEAVEIQKNLAGQIVLEDRFSTPYTVAGLDVGYDYTNNLSKAAAVVLKGASFEPCLSAVAYAETPFPYISGLLSFREIPVLLKLLSILPEKPDLICVDGQGIAHPRRIGIASHLGVLADIPTVGFAKSKLCGTFTMPDQNRGSYSALKDRGEHVGYVYRSRDNVKPIYISPGHRVSVETSLKLAQKYSGGFRLPEPTRMADKLSKFIK